MALLAPIALALGSCAHIAGVNEPARAGYAHISIPRLENGRPSVAVFRVHPKKGLYAQLDLAPDVHEVASFALKPGDHTLEVACLRPNAVDVVDGLWSFNVTVEANESYVLDCTPTKAKGQDYFENHFALSKVESQETREPPLELGSWLGCYDVSVGEGDTPMPLGIVRLTDRLEPPTAGAGCRRTIAEGQCV